MSKDTPAHPYQPAATVPLPAAPAPSEGDVVGWGGKARWSDATAFTASALIARELAALGVRHGFGVLGGGIAAFADGLRKSPIRLFHTRHEAGAAFAAVEAHFATGRPTLVVTTTGPGLWNALNGAMAARADGAKLLLISGATSRAQLGRGAVQETAPWLRANAAKSVRGSWVSTGAMPSAPMPCWFRPSCASLSTSHTTSARYATAVLISLFISIAPSPILALRIKSLSSQGASR